MHACSNKVDHPKAVNFDNYQVLRMDYTDEGVHLLAAGAGL